MKKMIYTPTVTVFDKNQKLDFDANGRVIEYLLNSGVDGLVPLGSTGEFSAFSFTDRKNLIEYYAKKVNGKIPIIAGTASMDFDETVRMSEFVHSLGLKGAIVLMPYYFGASQQNIFDYYDALASKVKTNLYIYNYPARTGSDIEPATLLRLLQKHKNIKGIKDTHATISHTKLVAKAVLGEFSEFEIYSGYDDQFVDNIIAGGVGCISGLSNIAPDIWQKLVKSANEADFANLMRYSKAINKLMEIYSLDVNFSLIFKKLMNLNALNLGEFAIFPFNSLQQGLYEQGVDILNSARELAK